jgi:hypothetical protein
MNEDVSSEIRGSEVRNDHSGNQKPDKNPAATCGKKALAFVLGLVIGMAVAGVTAWVVFDSNKLSNGGTVITPNGDNAVVDGAGVVCGNDDVERYNDLLNREPLVDVAEEIDQFYNDIKRRADINQDATCQFMLYRIADYNVSDETTEYITNLKVLNEHGRYPNNKIYDLTSLGWLE